MLLDFAGIPLMLCDPDRLPSAVLATLLVLAAGAVTGPMAGNSNPLVWFVIDWMLGGLGDRLNKIHRAASDLIFRGFLLVVLALALALLLGRGTAALAIWEPFFGVTEIVLLSACLTGGSVFFSVYQLYFSMKNQKLEKGSYYAISRSTRINLTATDDFGIARTAMGYTARAFDKGLAAPLFWYLIAGLPGAYLYAALAALAWRFGKDGFTKGSGSAALFLERIFGFIPGLCAALLITLAALFTPTAGLVRGMRAWFGHGSRAAYATGGAPLSALAWSLNVNLGGAQQDLSGSAIKSAWVGPPGATARNDHRHLRRAMYIMAVAHLLLAAALCGVYLAAAF